MKTLGPPSRIILAIAMLALSPVASGDPTDDDIDGKDTKSVRRLAAVANGTVYQWIFGRPTSSRDADQKVDTILRQKIAIVDRLCMLTDAQKEKLNLAVRGDSKRFFDRVEDIEKQLRLVKNDPDKVQSLSQEAQLLQRGLVRTGVPKDGSLFVKSLEQLLTPEQSRKYAPLRAVFREGGLIESWPREPGEVLGINMSGTTINDDDLANLSQLSRLASLGLNGTAVADAGMAHLAGVANLQTLTLQDTHVTDAGLVHLKGLTKLEWLAISSQHVTDAGLTHLNGLSELKGLLLGKTRITDAGLATFKSFTNLQMLGLGDTDVTDEGLAQLQHLTHLQQLDLANTNISDKGLAHIKVLTSLKQLNLSNTQVTESGTAELKNAIPSLTIRK